MALFNCYFQRLKGLSTSSLLDMSSPRSIADSTSTVDGWVSTSEVFCSIIAGHNHSTHETATKTCYSHQDYADSVSSFGGSTLKDDGADSTIEDAVLCDADLAAANEDSAMSIQVWRQQVGFNYYSINCRHSRTDFGQSYSKDQSQNEKKLEEGDAKKECVECQFQNWYNHADEEKLSEGIGYRILSPAHPWETLDSLEAFEVDNEDGDVSSTLDESVTRDHASTAKITTGTSETPMRHIPGEYSTEFQSYGCSSVVLLACSRRRPSKPSATLSPLLWLPMELLLEVMKYLEPCAWTCLGLTCTFFYNQFRENYAQPVSLVTPLLSDNASRFQWKLWHLLVGFMAPEFVYDPKYMIFRPRSRVGTRLSVVESQSFWSGRSLFDRLCIVNEKASRATKFNKGNSDFNGFNNDPEQPTFSHIEYLIPNVYYPGTASNDQGRRRWTEGEPFDQNLDQWCSGLRNMKLAHVARCPSKAAMAHWRNSKRKARKQRFAHWRYG
jgi:hypothetical protein